VTKIAAPSGKPASSPEAEARTPSKPVTAAKPAPDRGVVELELGRRLLGELDTWARENGNLTRSAAAKRLIARGMGRSSSLMRSS